MGKFHDIWNLGKMPCSQLSDRLAIAVHFRKRSDDRKTWINSYEAPRWSVCFACVVVPSNERGKHAEFSKIANIIGKKSGSVERTSLNANYIENYLKILEDMIIMDQQFPNNISIAMTDPCMYCQKNGVPFTIKKYPSHVSASIYHHGIPRMGIWSTTRRRRRRSHPLDGQK